MKTNNEEYQMHLLRVMMNTSSSFDAMNDAFNDACKRKIQLFTSKKLIDVHASGSLATMIDAFRMK